MNKYKGYTNMELLETNGGRDFQDSQLEEMEGITCPTEEILDYLLNPDKYAKTPKKLLQHALICKCCRRILYNPKIQKLFIYAMTRQTAFEFLNTCKKV
ncbi:MAG: hypothetical protein GX638_19055 [Crenarchaeota archaeon]|nr:hypothetical protein [Thermoproteota archaeon]